jgi:hypothetical protein
MVLKNSIKNTLILCCLVTSCINNRIDDSMSETSNVDRKIVYLFDSTLTRFIADSIMNPMFCKEVRSCVFKTCEGKTEIIFGYRNDDIDSQRNFLENSSNRYLQIYSKQVPIVFEEDHFADYSNLDTAKLIISTDNWMDYAVLKIDRYQQIIEFKNYLPCVFTKK